MNDNGRPKIRPARPQGEREKRQKYYTDNGASRYDQSGVSGIVRLGLDQDIPTGVQRCCKKNK